MTSFGWKKKSGEKVSRTASAAFEDNALDTEEVDSALLGEGEIDWLSLQQSAKRCKVIQLEDRVSKAVRLRNEGVVLAEQERFWEAIKKWDAALELTPNDEKVYEMKAQAYTALSEVFPAVTAAQKAVELSPLWWIAHQTLGRAHLGLGEVRSAILEFSRAAHINPADRDLWENDLLWAHNLWLQKQRMVAAQRREETDQRDADMASTVTVTELGGDSHAGHKVTSDKLGQESTLTTTKDEREMTRFVSPREDVGAESMTSSDTRQDDMMVLPDGYVKMRDAT